ncbi:amidohydrolase family protein [Novosphingobium flavum]|uniref:Amidohydrolase family protein n=1 Tax=Novosphingobium flavum TaxID=1778672 RepID=A0A7X1FTK0_9SPHN|nr:amidohydrolase family protein [Novosphingobium flavum]
MKIDSHQHFWAIGRGDYGWIEPSSVALWRDYLPDDLEPLIKQAGVSRTILVQAAPTDAETAFLIELARITPFVAGVVGWADFDASSAPQRIAALAEAPTLVGLRPMVQDIADPEWLARPSLDAAFAALVEADLALDALVRPIHLPALEKRLSRTPGLRVVIDHGAKPHIASGEIAIWREAMSHIARETNVRCKLSGFATEAGADWGEGVLRPYSDSLLEAFGPQRLLWGSDWPVLNSVGSYARWVEATDRLLADLGADDREWIWFRAATEFYQLGAQA